MLLLMVILLRIDLRMQQRHTKIFSNEYIANDTKFIFIYTYVLRDIAIGYVRMWKIFEQLDCRLKIVEKYISSDR